MRAVETSSAGETFELARNIGEKAFPGEVIGLTGDLGTGKTVFAKGIAAGLGITERVNSPTFTIMQQYDGGRLPLYHFDVYRIGDISEMDETGYEDYFYGKGVSIVEWAETIKEIMPEDTVWITIEKDLKNGTDHRRVSIEDEHTGN
ncbi:MAG: tRNA (adenosine(37)-N6)-threonylcarbamoyltransferase complex ATPase subunit type 1 TsaE [Lachnospiraceae bacterium]|nr:tRNA (adenosine(37)-N6)-threonylcarbamoyltransferase complex ATPase subunit type 1 TsaE [Lachnospiraceae bacterium]